MHRLASAAPRQSTSRADAFRGGVSVAVGAGSIVTGAGAGGNAHVKAFRSTDSAEVLSFSAFEGFTGGVEVATGFRSGRSGEPTIAASAGFGAVAHLRVYRRSDFALLKSEYIGSAENLAALDAV